MKSASGKIVREGWPFFERLLTARHVTGPVASEEAELLARWRKAIAPQQEAAFARRLEWSGLDALQAIWAAVPSIYEGLALPAWLPLLGQLQQVCRDAEPALEEIDARAQPFQELLRPVCSWALKRLSGELDDAMRRWMTQQALRSLSDGLLQRLAKLMSPVLYRSFSDYRGVGATLVANMTSAGEADLSEREVYFDFVKHHLATGLDELLEEFPVLGRLLSVTVELWLSNSVEVIRRVYRNRAILCEEFGIDPDALLQDVEPNLSDPHRGGQTVLALCLGTSASQITKLIYKPRSLAVDRAYQAFLGFLNELPNQPGFRIVKIASFEDYGFMEFVEHETCECEHELAQFYLNTGSLLAVLYILACNDCHHENLVASSNQLVLIDVETLLQAVQGGAAGYDRSQMKDLDLKLTQSVLSVGLLPQWRFFSVEGGLRAIDSSALGISAPKGATFKEYDWGAVNSDSMRWELMGKSWRTPASSPTAASQPELLFHHRQQLQDGFRTQMQSLFEHRDAILKADGPLNDFSGLRRRVVVRPTQIYHVIGLQACEPDALRSGAARGVVLDQLSRKYLVSSRKPFDWPVFEEEVRQLESLDIPYFDQMTDGDELLLPSDRESIVGFAQTSGLAACRTRLERLRPDEINFQIQLINGTIDARYLKPGARAPEVLDANPAEAMTEAETDESRSSLETRGLAEAVRLAEELQLRCIRGPGERVDWLGLDLGADQERFSFGVLGPSLYSGNSGIAVFFAALAKKMECSGTRAEVLRLRASAVSAVAGVLDLVRSTDNFAVRRWLRDETLGLSGVGGLLTAFMLLQKTDCEPIAEGYRECALTFARALDLNRLEKEHRVDLISGSAGLVGPLLALAEMKRLAGEESATLIAAAVACGRHIVQKQGADGSWHNAAAKRNLTGFSHGAAGIVAALARLYEVTKLDVFLSSARRGLAYERLEFSPSARNWPDYRSSAEPLQFMNSWCHGAAGIALARLCLRGTELWDNAAEEELETALGTTAREMEQGVDHLCCGAFGRAAILHIAAGRGLGIQWADRSAAIVEQRMRAARRNGGVYKFDWLSDTNTFLPGLFNGNAGVGLQLISMTDSSVVEECMACGLLGS